MTNEYVQELLTKLKNRRDFFQQKFQMVPIGIKRVDVDIYKVLKNTCPACGYLTLSERNSFDICSLCFWEDDGLDDFEENECSGPNHVTLYDYRIQTIIYLDKIVNSNDDSGYCIKELKKYLLKIDDLIVNYSEDKKEELKYIINCICILLESNKIYGIDQLFKTN